MELTEEPFDLVEFFTSNGEISDPQYGSEENLPETKKRM